MTQSRNVSSLKAKDLKWDERTKKEVEGWNGRIEDEIKKFKK